MGLASQLGVQAYARERKFRERLRLWLDLVRLYSPACPARIAKNGAFLELNNATAVHAERPAQGAANASATLIVQARLNTRFAKLFDGFVAGCRGRSQGRSGHGRGRCHHGSDAGMPPGFQSYSHDLSTVLGAEPQPNRKPALAR